MVKHRFEVVGFNDDKRAFNSTCIAYQIEDACKLYRERHFHLQSVTMMEQVKADAVIAIETITYENKAGSPLKRHIAEEFEYKGLWNCNCVCHIEIINNVVICTELKKNTGTSVTNFVEKLRVLVCERYEIPVEDVIWFEDNGGFTLVTFDKSNRPSWKSVTRDYAIQVSKCGYLI